MPTEGNTTEETKTGRQPYGPAVPLNDEIRELENLISALWYDLKNAITDKWSLNPKDFLDALVELYRILPRYAKAKYNATDYSPECLQDFLDSRTHTIRDENGRPQSDVNDRRLPRLVKRGREGDLRFIISMIPELVDANHKMTVRYQACKNLFKLWEFLEGYIANFEYKLLANCRREQEEVQSQYSDFAASSNGNTDTGKLLPAIESIVKALPTQKSLNQALINAVRTRTVKSDLLTIRRLIKEGARIPYPQSIAMDDEIKTVESPLQVAAYNGKPEAVAAMLDHIDAEQVFPHPRKGQLSHPLNLLDSQRRHTSILKEIQHRTGRNSEIETELPDALEEQHKQLQKEYAFNNSRLSELTLRQSEIGVELNSAENEKRMWMRLHVESALCFAAGEGHTHTVSVIACHEKAKSLISREAMKTALWLAIDADRSETVSVLLQGEFSASNTKLLVLAEGHQDLLDPTTLKQAMELVTKGRHKKTEQALWNYLLEKHGDSIGELSAQIGSPTDEQLTLATLNLARRHADSAPAPAVGKGAGQKGPTEHLKRALGYAQKNRLTEDVCTLTNYAERTGQMNLALYRSVLIITAETGKDKALSVLIGKISKQPQTDEPISVGEREKTPLDDSFIDDKMLCELLEKSITHHHPACRRVLLHHIGQRVREGVPIGESRKILVTLHDVHRSGILKELGQIILAAQMKAFDAIPISLIQATALIQRIRDTYVKCKELYDPLNLGDNRRTYDALIQLLQSNVMALLTHKNEAIRNAAIVSSGSYVVGTRDPEKKVDSNHPIARLFDEEQKSDGWPGGFFTTTTTTCAPKQRYHEIMEANLIVTDRSAQPFSWLRQNGCTRAAPRSPPRGLG